MKTEGLFNEGLLPIDGKRPSEQLELFFTGCVRVVQECVFGDKCGGREIVYDM